MIVTYRRKHDRTIVDITGSILTYRRKHGWVTEDITESILTYRRKHDRTLVDIIIIVCYTDSKTAQSNSSEHYRVLYIYIIPWQTGWKYERALHTELHQSTGYRVGFYVCLYTQHKTEISNILNNMNSLILKAVQDFIAQSGRFAMEWQTQLNS